MANKKITARVKRIRQWMCEERVDALVVPTVDPHNSEYLPEHYKARQWLTGFTGSAGTAVVTAEAAALWTDSRYYLQAAGELEDTPFALMREGLADTPSVAGWLDRQLGTERTVCVCGELMTQELFEALFGGEESRFSFKVADYDPFADLWSRRPPLPSRPVEVMPVSEAGLSARAKLDMVRDMVRRACPEAAAVLVNDLSEIAWTLNLRGADIEYNPVFLSYLLVHPRGASLFVARKRLPASLTAYLDGIGVSVQRYHDLENIVGEAAFDGLLALPPAMNLRVKRLCEQMHVDYRFIDWQLPLLRAVKTPEEQQGFRRAMERDGAALVSFMRRFEEALKAGQELTETDVDDLLTACRAAQPGYRGLSFATIAGYGPHGAIVHYEATPQSAARLERRGLLLLDSGAHYDSGTTDITRTLALGPVTEEERRVYTLVLKGHIALARCRFPEGTTGLQLDTAARYALWQQGYDFGHGTGHGVGHCLCVHEGPHQIRKNLRACTVVPFRAGMTVTDEPGVYVDGRFGVRIENTLLVVDGGATPYGRFLRFESLTLCPYDLRPVDPALLTADERQWIDDYHAAVRARLMPLLADEADRAWLDRATRPL